MTATEILPAQAEPDIEDDIIHVACTMGGEPMTFCSVEAEREAPNHVPIDCVVCDDILRTAPTFCPRFETCRCSA